MLAKRRLPLGFRRSRRETFVRDKRNLRVNDEMPVFGQIDDDIRMLPSAVRVVCIDINPAVVTKLGDRGSSQTVGIVTDTGLFLHQLAETLGA